MSSLQIGSIFVNFKNKVKLMKFENNKSENGGVITISNEIKEVGRLTYTIFPEDNKLIISFVLVHPEFEGRGMGKYLVIP